MTSNNSSSKWSVRIVHLPVFINHIRLAQELRLPKSRVYIPKVNNNNTSYAWNNDFDNEENGNEFVRQWSGVLIQGQKIKCLVSSPRSDQNDFFHSSQESLVSEIKPLPNKQRNYGLSTESKIRRESLNALTTSPSSFHHSSNDQNTFQNPQKSDCSFDHPDSWNPCVDGDKCEDYECTANHPYTQKAKCRDGSRCKAINCKFIHPKIRTGKCSFRAKCKLWYCSKLHPLTRARPCSNKNNCTNLPCLCLHPPERAELICQFGADCRVLSCRLSHPSERPPKCEQADVCSNFNCTRLHQPEWDPCEVGDDCEDKQCSKIHSTNRNINLQKNKAAIATDVDIKDQNQKIKKYLKTFEQRIKDRAQAQLPILSCREEFCQRFEREHVLIVTAETGSGKSTQLPQYAMKHFGSLVVCTQSRVVAALSLARRVAEEYDGKSVGESVGYQVGNANRVRGTDIMHMTDAALIR